MKIIENKLFTFPLTSFLVMVLFSCLHLTFFSCNNNENKTKEYDNIIDSALKIYNYGEKTSALLYLDSALTNHDHLPVMIQYRIYNFKRIYYYYIKDFDKSYIYTDSMLDILESNHADKSNKMEYANALSVKADNYWEQNILNKAFEYYFKSRIISESIGDTCALSNINYHMGMISYRQGKFKDAIQLFKYSFTENNNCPKEALNFYRSQELLNNIALSFNKLKSYDSALFYYHKTLDFLNNDIRNYEGTHLQYAEMAKAVVFGNIAKILIVKEQKDSAIKMLNESIAINLKPGNDREDALLEQMQLAEVLYQTNDNPGMLNVLTAVKNNLDSGKFSPINRIRINEVRLRYNHLLYEYYNKQNKSDDALKYLGNYIKIKDSLVDENKELNTINVQQLLEYRETFNANKLLVKTNELDKLYLWISIGFCIFILIIIGLTYNNYKKSNKHVQALTVLNQQINEQKSQVEFAVAQLEKNNEDKDRILYMVVHDLRNPVNGIIFLADLLLEDNISGAQKENLDMVMSAAQSCSALINDLLEISSGKIYEEKTKKSIEDANELVKYIVNLMQFRTIDKKQQVQLKLSDSSAYVFVNKEKMRRALSNILFNAVKFSPPKAVIEVALERKNKTVIISIKDSGIGIPDNMKPFIFDMFTTAKRHGTEGEKSFGLGLSICKQIVEANNGKLWFTSEEGYGSTFFIQLPEID